MPSDAGSAETSGTRRRIPVSVVCVYNDLEVRQQCLDRSLMDHAAEAPEIEYLPIDNTLSAFSSAGAALNYGARQARNPYIVFVHQDVYLHSLVALEEAAGALEDSPGFGVVGAVGIASNSAIVGRIRDRVVFSGPQVTGLSVVDSIDEVLFIASRGRLLDEPLTEDPDLAWHAYAVEYGMRLGGQGLRVGVADIPLTHNSLTINLARLDVAHQTLARRYPESPPIQTTCGRIPPPPLSPQALPLLRVPRRGARFLVDSLTLAGARVGRIGSIARSDVRREVDRFLEESSASPFAIINVTDAPGAFGTANPLALTRRGQPVTCWALPVEETLHLITELRDHSSLLLTDLSRVTVRSVARQLTDPLVGYDDTIGFWILSRPRS